jgi:hypothetical protein
MPRRVQIAPVLEVRNVKASEAFYREKVGFGPGSFAGDSPCFCIVRRDGVSIFGSNTGQINPLGLVAAEPLPLRLRANGSCGRLRAVLRSSRFQEVRRLRVSTSPGAVPALF